MGHLAVLMLLAYGFCAQQLPAPAPPPPPPPMPPALRPAPPCEAYWKAQAVFSGEILEISRPSAPFDPAQPDPRGCAAPDFRLVAEASVHLFVLDPKRPTGRAHNARTD